MLDWDIETLKKYKEEAEYAYNVNPSECTAHTFNCYESLGNELEIDTEDDEENEETITVRDIKEMVSDFKEYFESLPQVTRKYLLRIITSFDVLFKKNVNSDVIKLKQRKSNTNTLVRQSYKLFKSLDPTIENYLDYIYENKLVKFDQEFSDRSFVCKDYYNGVGWMWAHNGEKYLTETTFNHELAHTLDIVVNPQLDLMRRKSGLEETNSIFCDLLTHCDIISKYKNNQKEENAIISDANYFSFIKRSIISLGLLYSISKMKNINKKSLEELLYLKYDLTLIKGHRIYDIIGSLNDYDSATYIISNILALHMLDAYKEDAEKGAYLYRTSLYSTRNDILGYLTDLEFDPEDIDYGLELLFNKNKEVNNNLMLLRK